MGVFNAEPQVNSRLYTQEVDWKKVESQESWKSAPNNTRA